MPFTKTWDETAPTKLSTAVDIDLYIKDDKIAVRERFESLLGIADFATRFPMSADALKMNGAATSKILGGTAGFAIANSAGTALVTFDTTAGSLTLGGHTVNKITRGTFPQYSGPALGFDTFTPTNGVMYDIIVFGKDATGIPANAYIDKLTVFGAAAVTWTVLSSTTLVGAPAARTYSNNAGKLKIAHAAGATWYADIAYICNSLI